MDETELIEFLKAYEEHLGEPPQPLSFTSFDFMPADMDSPGCDGGKWAA